MHGMNGVCYDARVVVDGYPDSSEDAEETPGLLQYVAHRQESHGKVFVADRFERHEVGGDGGVVVGVGYHHAFWLAGGPGGVNKRGHVLGEAVAAALFHEAAHIVARFHAETHEVVPEDGDGIVGGKLESVVLEHHYTAHGPWVGFPVVVSQGILVAVSHEEDAGLAVAHYEVELRLRAGGVNGDNGHAVFKGAELGYEDLGCIG